MAHPLVTQLRFARSEFVRCLEGVSDEDSRKRLLPMNCISWMVGHLAAQEQDYFVFFPKGKVPHPQLNVSHGFGQPAVTPPLADMWQVWGDVTEAADTFLDTVTKDQLGTYLEQNTNAVKESLFVFGQANEKMLAQEKVRSADAPPGGTEGNGNLTTISSSHHLSFPQNLTVWVFNLIFFDLVE